MALSTAQVAEKLGTDARTLRKFLRSDACKVESVGKGARYELDTKSVPTLRKQFAAWSTAQATKSTPEATDPSPATHTVKEATGGQPTS
jgi:hypothetical protein